MQLCLAPIPLYNLWEPYQSEKPDNLGWIDSEFLCCSFHLFNKQQVDHRWKHLVEVWYQIEI
jgi:hypothetical protein